MNLGFAASGDTSASAPLAGPGKVEIYSERIFMGVRLKKSANLPEAVKSKNSVVLE